MSSVGDSFAWPFQGPGWFGKMIVQGLIAIIPLIGWIAGKSSMNFAFLVVSATMVLASVLWLIGIPYLGRDTANITAIESPSSPSS